MTGPSSASIMALHSMCHPGRPGPQGLSQLGSPGLALWSIDKGRHCQSAATHEVKSPAVATYLPQRKVGSTALARINSHSLARAVVRLVAA